MSSLIVDLADALGDEAPGAATATGILRRHLGVDRVSVSRIDPVAGTFEILHTAGDQLLVRGTRLPVAISSHFAAAAERRTFMAADFAAEPTFDKPVDDVVRAAGFGSGCAIPVERRGETVGAIALTSRVAGRSYDRTLGPLRAAAKMLALTIDPDVAPPLALLCHADPLVGHGLARLVERTIGARVVVCGTLEEARLAVEAEPPDLILCDDHLDGMRIDGVAVALRQAGSSAPVAVVATHDTVENRAAALRAGISAYLPRADAPGRLPRALFALQAGRTILPEPEPPGPRRRALTERELEFLVRLEDGLRLKQIAIALGISEATAKTHARHVFRKLGASSRGEAVHEARRQGLLG